MKLLIVESPAKCKKIQGFLGAGWRVVATMGHIRALKEELECIGFRTTWTPTYECIREKSAAIANLRSNAKGLAHTDIYLGSDDDREGEAIAWHTCAVLGLDPATTPRVVFHEITETALKSAVAHPTTIDMNKFLAQQARSMLDFLLGFTLSPMLWKGVGFKPGLSAGRCQTPALRIVYDRDETIAAHQTVSMWKLSATTPLNSSDIIQWTSALTVEGDEEMKALLNSQTPNITITGRSERQAVHQAPQPFITSSLQQEASARLSMNPKVTMRLAQTLYEEGHITYMRTDNPVLSQEAIQAASEYITKTWGEEYVQDQSVSTKSAKIKSTKIKKTKKKEDQAQTKTTQAAHEAIRPTHMDVSTVEMPAQEQRLYAMIWKRTIQSIMKPEICDIVRIKGTSPIEWESEWSKVHFSGWRILDAERNGVEEKKAAELFAQRTSEQLAPPTAIPWSSLQATEHHTTPVPRFTEASLIRELEARGIGRPSTYATLIDTVLERGYVEKATIEHPPKTIRRLEKLAGKPESKISSTTGKATIERDKLRTTALGRTVIEWLLNQVGDMVAYDQTVAMEVQLDEVAKGTRLWQSVLTEAWGRYAERYDTVMASKSTSISVNAKSATYGDGYKMVVSKKGPLFVLEKEGEKTKFAKVPANLSLQTATRQDAETAFTAAETASTIDILGELEGESVQRKKGPYGYYVVWRSMNLACKLEDTLETLSPKLLAKVESAATAVNHTVGPYVIRSGQYGLYMYKATSSNRKPTFVNIPAATPWATITPESAEQIYKHCLETKKSNARKEKEKEKKKN
jgi:DNA topoisomerase-1